MKHGGKKGGWRKFNASVSRSDIKAMAKVVYVCRGCDVWNRPRWDAVKDKELPPANCISCGRMDFDLFQSESEARAWARLKLRARIGEISELERQVRIPLLTVNHSTGKPVEWATFVADFRYVEAGVRKLVECKPAGVMSYDAQLKIRCCEAMGIPVEIIS